MRLSNHTIAILVADGVEDLEFYVPYMRLQEEGAKTIVAGLDLNPVCGKNGLAIVPDARADSLEPGNLLGLVIPGGWAPDKLRRYEYVTWLVREMNAAGKILGIICHGGSVAVSAGIVQGRRSTGSLGIRDDLLNAGAQWIDEPALRDGNLVWGRVVADIPDFCRLLVAALVEAAQNTEKNARR